MSAGLSTMNLVSETNSTSSQELLVADPGDINGVPPVCYRLAV